MPSLPAYRVIVDGKRGYRTHVKWLAILVAKLVSLNLFLSTVIVKNERTGEPVFAKRWQAPESSL